MCTTRDACKRLAISYNAVLTAKSPAMFRFWFEQLMQAQRDTGVELLRPSDLIKRRE